jgi:hypothetical protein
LDRRGQAAQLEVHELLNRLPHLHTMRTPLFATLLCCLALPAQQPTPTPTPPAPAPAPPGATVGQPAPAFRLNDQTGALVSVGGEDKDGDWTVLAFYPKAATPG